MSKVDIVLILILGLGGFLGYKRGFLMELFFLIALILGVFIGFKLMGAGVSYLQREFNADKTFLPYLSFFIIFIVVMMGVFLLGKAIKNSVDQTFLGRMDAIAGGVLGLLKYAFCVSILLWLATSLRYTLPVSWTKKSLLYPIIVGFAPKMAGLLGGVIPFFKEIFRQF